jgi:sulfur carrier protein ThiS
MKSDSANLVIQKKTIPCRVNIPIRKAMTENGLSPSAYLIVRNKELVTDDEIIKSGDTIELIAVISGG